MRVSVLFLSGLLIAAPASAQMSSDGMMSRSGAEMAGEARELPENASDERGEANGERRICRRVEATETRMSSRRVCMTAREWRDYNRDN